jgi:hypothetical protein
MSKKTDEKQTVRQMTIALRYAAEDLLATHRVRS